MNLSESIFKKRAIKLSIYCLVLTLAFMSVIPDAAPLVSAQDAGISISKISRNFNEAAMTGSRDKFSAPVTCNSPALTCTNPTVILTPGVGTSGGVAGPDYPSVITFAGLTGTVATVAVTLNGLSANRLSDLDVLLVSPAGQNFLIMSDGSGLANATPIVNQTLTLSDAGAAQFACAALPTTGTWRPTDHGSGGTCDSAQDDTLPPPAPAGVYNSAGPNPQYGAFETMNGVFGNNGSSPNGNWLLYINDDFASVGTNGTIAGGWTLTLTLNAPTAASATVSGRVLRPSGSGIYRTQVTMVDSEGQVRAALTNGFGYFQFTEVQVGGSYVFTVNSKEYQFKNPTQVVTVNEDLTDVNFVSME